MPKPLRPPRFSNEKADVPISPAERPFGRIAACLGGSEVGERIMDLVNGVRTVGDIIAVLCEEFDVERDVCTTETVKFVALLVEKQVLQV